MTLLGWVVVWHMPAHDSSPATAQETALNNPSSSSSSSSRLCLHWGGANSLCVILGMSAATKLHIFAPESPGLGNTACFVQYLGRSRAVSAPASLGQQQCLHMSVQLCQGG